MEEDEEYGDYEGWVEQEDILCKKCDRPLDCIIYEMDQVLQ
ncbi:hypothetical protein R84B8_00329 [Treponema sp. R8-4-B8]